MNSTTVLIVGTDSAFLEGSRLLGLLRDGQMPFEHMVIALHERTPDQWKADLSQVLRRSKPDVALLTPQADRGPALSRILDCIKESRLSLPVLLLTDNSNSNELAQALRGGVADFSRLPLEVADFLPRLWRLKPMCPSHPVKLQSNPDVNRPTTRNYEFRKQLQKLLAFAKHDVTILITGETGTGKEVAAREVHRSSLRRSKAFLPVNCGAMPADLIENEFFGHEAEAFSGASSGRPGLVSEAEGGTLFLDEIDSAPLPFQAKLLRLLQNQEFRPVGGTKVLRANVRVIAAANSDLEAAIREGRFRRDLYYRLNILRIHMPPLRDRAEDIPLLAQQFVERYSAQFGKSVQRISPSALEALSRYRWPGNIRELENVIERAVILCEQDELSAMDMDLPLQIQAVHKSFRMLKSACVNEFERSYLLDLLNEHKGNITEAASAAGKHRRALFQLIRKHRIQIIAGSAHCNMDISSTKQDSLVLQRS
jgi:two-component system, NtrC family, response regulator GlrR